MSGGGTSTNTVSSSVPSWLQPYYTTGINQASNLLASPGPQYYPGQTVAPLNPVQESGIQSTVNAAGAPNASAAAQGANQYETSGALIDPSQNAAMQSINAAGQGPSALGSSVNANNFLTSGALLNPSSNPYLQGTFTQAANAAQNQLATEFAGSGRNIIGSLPVQSDEMNNLATQLYGGAYQQGVNQMGSAVGNTAGLTNAQYTPAQLTSSAYGTGLQNMTTASGLAPSIDAGTYLPGQELLQTGAGLQGQTQNLINANQTAYNYNQQLPYNQLSYYSGLLGQTASPYSTGASTTQTPSNPWATAAGVGLTGAGLYSSGLLGTLGGLFGGGGGSGALAGLALA